MGSPTRAPLQEHRTGDQGNDVAHDADHRDGNVEIQQELSSFEGLLDGATIELDDEHVGHVDDERRHHHRNVEPRPTTKPQSHGDDDDADRTDRL